MRTDGRTTIEAVMLHSHDLLVVPPLFNEPAEGWVNWAVEYSGETERMNPDTVSGRLAEAAGPAWFYGLLLPHILNGRYETALREAIGEGSRTARIENGLELTGFPEEWLVAAKKARLDFEAGRPLYIAPWEGVERYRRVPVTLQRVGDGQYQVGGQTFRANSVSAALDKARQIYIEVRRKEIEAARKAVLSFAGTVPPLVLDLLTAMLQRDKALIDNEGLPLAWENGAHGMYAVQGLDWCYMLNCSAPVAAGFAAMSQHQSIRDGQRVSIRVDLTGKVAGLLGFLDWRRTETGFAWQGGRWLPLQGETNRGIVRLNDRPRLFVAESSPVTREQHNWIGRLYNAKKDVVIESAAPANLNLTQADVLAWVIWRGMKRGKTNDL